MELNLQTLKNVYFIGIGGIGMSAIARYFNMRGIQVEGYDKTPTPLTQQLENEGIKIHFEENIDLIPQNPAPQLVIYTPAIPAQHAELQFFLKHNFLIKKRSEVLAWLTQHTHSIAIAGTHGKTTISSLVSHILHHAGTGCTAFVGGIMTNYNSNFLLSTNNLTVVEADEYDRSFLKLHPQLALVSATDPDHLDIYHTPQAMYEAYTQFVQQTLQQPNTQVIVKQNIEILKNLQNTPNLLTYALQKNEQNNDPTPPTWYAQNIHIQNHAYQFDIFTPKGVIQNCTLQLAGKHNVENAVAATAIAQSVGIENEQIRNALLTFKGIKRRFEYIINTPKRILIDDYAHHPQEISAFLGSVKEMYPNHKVTVIFQPHLYTRTRDFATQFAHSLNLAHQVIMLEIYPARELPIEGITSNIIFDNIHTAQKNLLLKKDLLQFLTLHKKEFEVICTVGAGDIDLMLPQIKEVLE